MQNTAKNTLSDAAAASLLAPDTPAEADAPAIAATAVQPDGGGSLPPVTPRTSPAQDPRDFGRYWPVAAAILKIDVPTFAAVRKSQADSIAHHQKTRDQSAARITEIRDELARRERRELQPSACDDPRAAYRGFGPPRHGERKHRHRGAGDAHPFTVSRVRKAELASNNSPSPGAGNAGLCATYAHGRKFVYSRQTIAISCDGNGGLSRCCNGLRGW